MSTKAAQVDERREKERRRKIADAYLRQMAFQAATLLGAGTGSAGILSEYWKWKHGQDGLAAGVVALSSSAMAYGGFIETHPSRRFCSVRSHYVIWKYRCLL